MKILVTGGGGFLGNAIVRQLVERGHQVRILARSNYPQLQAMGVETMRGDIADADIVHNATKGCDAVFHVAAMAGVWGPKQMYYRVNVLGTENVINACRSLGVSQLIHTSSPSVVFDGQDQDNVTEDAPYPARYRAHYPRTKAMAEKMVLDANSKDLATVALRPHLIWGPGDPHLTPRIIERARAGRLVLIGDGNKQVDAVYIDNAAKAHLLALDAGAKVGGKAYFITNGQPLAMRELINDILAAADLPAVTKSVSPGAAYAIASIMENAYRLFRIKREPLLTRFVVRQLATSHWYDISAAQRDLGYEPTITMEQGMQRLRSWLQEGLRHD